MPTPFKCLFLFFRHQLLTPVKHRENEILKPNNKQISTYKFLLTASITQLKEIKKTQNVKSLDISKNEKKPAQIRNQKIRKWVTYSSIPISINEDKLVLAVRTSKKLSTRGGHLLRKLKTKGPTQN